MSVGGTAGGRIAPGVGANLIGQHAQDRNQDATIYVGNLDAQVRLGGERCSAVRCGGFGPRLTVRVVWQMTEEMVWELFVQAGPVGDHPFSKQGLLLHDIPINAGCGNRVRSSK